MGDFLSKCSGARDKKACIIIPIEDRSNHSVSTEKCIKYELDPKDHNEEYIKLMTTEHYVQPISHHRD